MFERNAACANSSEKVFSSDSSRNRWLEHGSRKFNFLKLNSRLIGRAVTTLPDDGTHRKVCSGGHFIDDFTKRVLFSEVPHPSLLANQANLHSRLIARTVPGFPRNGSGRETCSRPWNIDDSGDSAIPCKNLRNRGVGHTLRRGRDQGGPTPAQIPRKALVILPFRGRRTGPKSARDRKSMKTLG